MENYIIIICLSITSLALLSLFVVERTKSRKLAKNNNANGENKDNTVIDVYSKLLHNLRNTNASLESFIKIIEARTIDIYDTSKFNLIEEIKMKSNNSYFELENIKDFTNITRGISNIEKEDVNISEIVKSISKELERKLTFNKIVVECKIDPKETANWESYSLRRCLLNIIFNAMNFSSPGSKITITTNNIEGKNYIVVKDSGKGFDFKHLTQINNSEFCTPENGVNGYKGLGIGLYICKTFAKLNNSDLKFDSVLGSGTKVFLEV